MRKSQSIKPLILQSCPAENGAAALAMVLSYYGKPAAVGELMRDPMGTAADLISGARSRGIYAQGYQMSLEQICQAPFPLIAHWKFRSFVVVRGVWGGRIHICSPEDGYQTLSRREFAAGFTGAAICFAGEEPVRQEDPPRPARGRSSQAAAVLMLLGGAQLLIAVCYMMLSMLLHGVAAYMAAPQTEEILPLCLMIAGLLGLQGVAAAFQTRLIGRCRTALRDRDTQSFRERLRDVRIASFQRTAPLRLDAAVRSCTERAEAAASAAICATQLISGGICLVVMAVQDAAAAWAAVIPAALFTAVCLCRRDRLYSAGALEARDSFLTEELAAGDLSAWEANCLRNRDGACFARWAQAAGGASRSEERRADRYIASVLLVLCVLCVCLLEMLMGRSGTGDLLSCLALGVAAAASLEAVPRLLSDLMAIKRMREAERLLPSDGADSQEPGAGAVRTLTVQNVSQGLSHRADRAITDVTFTVRRGEILVVTADAPAREALASIVSGLERPAQGALYLDGRNAAELSDREVCASVMSLGRGLSFPRGTVRENITAGLRGLTDYAVVEAASAALLHQRILRRPARYDTPAASLSDGERVLLAFARAFARGTPFLVCDDVTKCLDRETEAQLIRNLRRRGIGAVLLTDDASLLRQGDLVCRVEEGRTTLRERAEFVEEGEFSYV